MSLKFPHLFLFKDTIPANSDPKDYSGKNSK